MKLDNSGFLFIIHTHTQSERMSSSHHLWPKRFTFQIKILHTIKKNEKFIENQGIQTKKKFVKFLNFRLFRIFNTIIIVASCIFFPSCSNDDGGGQQTTGSSFFFASVIEI